jgi:hypothetical protein
LYCRENNGKVIARKRSATGLKKTQKGSRGSGSDSRAIMIPDKNGNKILIKGIGLQGFNDDPFSLNQKKR